jgi:hypothetical protein
MLRINFHQFCILVNAYIRWCWKQENKEIDNNTKDYLETNFRFSVSYKYIFHSWLIHNLQENIRYDSGLDINAINDALKNMINESDIISYISKYPGQYANARTENIINTLVQILVDEKNVDELVEILGIKLPLQCECPICLDPIEGLTNFLITECGHKFHCRCLMDNIMHNGFGCPYCRTMMATPLEEEEEDDDLTISICSDSTYTRQSLLNEEDVLRGFRIFHNILDGIEIDKNDMEDEIFYQVWVEEQPA